METLPAEFGAAVAHADGFGVAALLDDRRNAIELRHCGGAVKALPVGAESHQPPRCQGGAGAGKAAKNRRVRVLIHGVDNGFVQALESFVQWSEHAGPGANQGASRLHDRAVGGQRFGRGHGLDPLLDPFGVAAIVFIEEGAQGLWLFFLQGFRLLIQA